MPIDRLWIRRSKVRILPRQPAPQQASGLSGTAPPDCRSELIVVDDIGQLPAGQGEAEALYRLVDAAYERRSLIMTSNRAPSAVDTTLPKGLAIATVDGLLHHAQPGL